MNSSNSIQKSTIGNAFKAINESFNQKGRLLIVGSPGSGKTFLLLKLALELLGDECKAKTENCSSHCEIVFINLRKFAQQSAKYAQIGLHFIKGFFDCDVRDCPVDEIRFFAAFL